MVWHGGFYFIVGVASPLSGRRRPPASGTFSSRLNNFGASTLLIFGGLALIISLCQGSSICWMLASLI
jgi:hypothetical protein